MTIQEQRERWALLDAIASEPFSPELLERALTALTADSSQVSARQLAAAMGVWGSELLPAATRMLADKQAGQRQKALELFAAIAEPSSIPELEAAKAGDRSKKLHRDYDYAIRRITKVAAERAREKVDPRDANVDPLARLVELENLPYAQLWQLLGVEERYWARDYAIPWLDFDRHGRRPFTLDGARWQWVFDDGALLVEGPSGKPTRSVPAAAKGLHTQLKRELRDLANKRVARLERALGMGERWPTWLWRLLYLDHPLADSSIRALVFEHELDGRRRTFSAYPDATLRDASGEPLDGVEGGHVGVAHPAQLDPADLAAWRQLADERGWVPPLSQLDRAVHRPTKDAALAERLAELPPCDSMSLAARLPKAGFEPGDVDEHGMIAERYRPLGDGYCVWLLHGAMAVRQGRNDRGSKTGLRRAWFTHEGKTVGATAVPARVYSEAVELLRQLAPSIPTNA